VGHGRREEFEALAPTLIEPIRRFLVRRTDPDTAEDVLAETLLVIWRRLDDVPKGEQALPWTYGVAKNCLANAERSARRQGRVAGKIAVVDPPREGGDEATARDDDLHDALARLRPDEQELLRLWAWEQLTPAEIAVVLELTPNAVSIRLHRAKQKLAEQLRTLD
jgi:RNA polymerase sigma-70 factor, ECF subfamily